jgi:hypothetical protein
MMSEEQQTIARPSREAYEASGTAIQRAGFGENALEKRDRVSTALAERAKAEIQARFIVALQRPRDLDDVRVRLLKHCKRPGFAALAEYEKKIGSNKVRGPSIRFVEAAIQEYGNMTTECVVIDEDEQRRTIRVSATDLERNSTYYVDVVVEKTVERKSPPPGSEVLGSRKNSYGETVLLVRATEDDLATKQGAIESKRIRTLALRLLPGDIVEECMNACRAVRQARDKADPDAARKLIVDSFAGQGIMPRHLEEFLGHPVEQCSPAELEELRVAYATVREGEARWIDLVEARRAERGEVEETSKAASAAASKLQARMAANAARAKEPITPKEQGK